MQVALVAFVLMHSDCTHDAGYVSSSVALCRIVSSTQKHATISVQAGAAVAAYSVANRHRGRAGPKAMDAIGGVGGNLVVGK